MAVKKGGLGRGLDSLFQDTGGNAGAGAQDGAAPLRIAEVEPDKNQPRKVFNQAALQELSDSIAQHGVLQPIVVRQQGAGHYIIVAGERRWRAARMAGLAEIPAIVRELSNEEAMEITMIENLQREDLDPVEEALGYKALMDSCGYTQEKAAKKLGKSRSAVANSLRILALPKPVLQDLQAGKLTQGHAKAILSLADAGRQQEAATRIIAEGLNVREAESLCKKLMQAPKQAPKTIRRAALPAEVELSLREALGTEVRVSYKEGKGQLQVSFYSDEQLKAFANLLGKYEKENQKRG